MSIPTSKPLKGKTIGRYIKNLPKEQARIVSSLVGLISDAAPESSGSIKWAQPVFEQDGPFCYVRAFNDQVNFGFWRGVDITSGRGILESGGQKMAHVKIAKVDDIRRELFKKWVKEAVRLNQAKGDPTKKR